MHPWVKGIQFCSNVGPRFLLRGDHYEKRKYIDIFKNLLENEGPCPFPKVENYKIAKLHWQNLKIFYSRTTRPISIKFCTKHSWVMKTQVCVHEGPCPFPKVENYKIVKIHWRNVKIFFSRTYHWANFNQIWHNASLGEGDSRLFKWSASYFPRGDNYKIAKIHWGNLKIFFPKITGPISTKFLGWRGFKFVQMKGSYFQGKIIKK